MPSGGVKKTYYYDGDRLIAEKWSTGAYLLYHYDQNGTPYALTYSSTGSGYSKYYLIKNLHGDVVQLRDVNNSLVANYEYDAWGNLISVKNASGATITSGIAIINPIRYKGYYYDNETGFYYLKTRYYDPANCRFISTDSQIDLDCGTVNLNLFAYCGSDPINRVDPTGESFWDALKDFGEKVAEVGGAVLAVAGAVAVIGAAAAGTYFSGGAGAVAIPAAVAVAAECLAAAGLVTVATGATAVAVGEVGGSVVEFSKPSKTSGKARSTDQPSWANKDMVDSKLSPQKNASNMLDNKYGKGNWPKGAKTEYNKIVKWITRHINVVK